ncbi:MAG: class I tRNA ligase family protein [Deltaproteobacteria bacterium]
MPPHAVYWPIMLKAAGIAPPKSLLAHGWWSINGSKMSKSTGNFVDAAEFADKYGVDALRYFLIREMSVGQDSDFSLAQFLARYNAERYLALRGMGISSHYQKVETLFAGPV